MKFTKSRRVIVAIILVVIVIIAGGILLFLHRQADSESNQSAINVAQDADNSENHSSTEVNGTQSGEASPTTENPADDQPRTSKGYLIENRDGVTYIDNILIANKSYPLPASYGDGITPEANAAFESMRQAAAQEGINLTIVSGFRSYTTQDWLYESYAARDGYAEADRYSARPGYSEHQTGLAMDLNWVDTDFANTPAGQWLHHHAWEYGFILRYPEGSEDIAGFIYEPWHFRYIGRTDLAKQLYNDGNWITLEEYYGFVSKYAD